MAQRFYTVRQAYTSGVVSGQRSAERAFGETTYPFATVRNARRIALQMSRQAKYTQHPIGRAWWLGYGRGCWIDYSKLL